MDINKVMLKGRLGKDPDFKTFDGGVQLAVFSLATSQKWRNKAGEINEKTTWHNVKVFGKMAEVARDYLKKGHEVFVEGAIENTEWNDKETGEKRRGIEILVSNLSLLTRTPKAEENGSNIPNQEDPTFTASDIPF